MSLVFNRDFMITAFCSDDQYLCDLLNDTVSSQYSQDFYELFATLFKPEVLFQY